MSYEETHTIAMNVARGSDDIVPGTNETLNEIIARLNREREEADERWAIRQNARRDDRLNTSFRSDHQDESNMGN